MEAAVWGLLGTIAGASASIGTTLIASRNAANLQASAAAADRLERHRAFQRDTLLDLQDALHDELRATSLVYRADETEFHRTGTWGAQPLGEELNQQAHIAGRRTLLLVERIADDALRDHVKAVRRSASLVLMVRDRSRAEHALAEMVAEGLSAIEHIGKVLRSLYVEIGP